MMAGNLLRISKGKLGVSQFPLLQQVAWQSGRSKIGNREVVGYGINGQYSYIDHINNPLPAIRFKEDTPDILALREKERGNWKNLSIEEKKSLYRSSFCSTYAEMKAPTGEWKSNFGVALMFISSAFWLYILAKLFVYPPLPDSCSLERRQAQLKRMIDLRVDPVDGLTSKWDYENNRWKK